MCHNWHRCHTLSHECVSAGCIYKIKGGVAVADEAELLLCRINLSLISVIVLTFEGVSGVEERTSCAQWDKRWPYVNCSLKKKNPPATVAPHECSVTALPYEQTSSPEWTAGHNHERLKRAVSQPVAAAAPPELCCCCDDVSVNV